MTVTAKSIHAIEQVLLVNADICELYEKRGVSRDDLREVFRLAGENVDGIKETVLREWRRLAAWPGVQIRTRAGNMGEIRYLAKNKRDLLIRLDGQKEACEILREDVFPIWWPEEEWKKADA